MRHALRAVAGNGILALERVIQVLEAVREIVGVGVGEGLGEEGAGGGGDGGVGGGVAPLEGQVEP
jgi:hypothetical protein